jgi:hypothetical protein
VQLDVNIARAITEHIRELSVVARNSIAVRSMSIHQAMNRRLRMYYRTQRRLRSGPDASAA